MRTPRYILKRLNIFARLKWLESRIAELEKNSARMKKLCHIQNGNQLVGMTGSDKRLHFIHVFGTNNVGDEFCGPEFYFSDFFREYDQYVHEFATIDFSSIRPNDVVIIGGGGILDYSDVWNARINMCMQHCKNVILWGCGFNHHLDHVYSANAIQYDALTLAGVRDYHCELEYLPCVSCMLPLLRISYPLMRRIGIVEHKAFPIDEFPSYEKLSNGTNDINTLLQFIGTSQVIITNTYHVWYWATLMNKKVILYEKFSTKFEHLRYESVMYSGNLEKDISRCETHPDAYAEAVRLNNEFACKVMELLKQTDSKE